MEPMKIGDLMLREQEDINGETYYNTGVLLDINKKDSSYLVFWYNNIVHGGTNPMWVDVFWAKRWNQIAIEQRNKMESDP